MESAAHMTEPAEFLTAEEAAALLRLKVATLHQWSHRRVGPPARKIGRRLLYRRDELVAWADAQVVGGDAA